MCFYAIWRGADLPYFCTFHRISACFAHIWPALGHESMHFHRVFACFPHRPHMWAPTGPWKLNVNLRIQKQAKSAIFLVFYRVFTPSGGVQSRLSGDHLCCFCRIIGESCNISIFYRVSAYFHTIWRGTVKVFWGPGVSVFNVSKHFDMFLHLAGCKQGRWGSCARFFVIFVDVSTYFRRPLCIFMHRSCIVTHLYVFVKNLLALSLYSEPPSERPGKPPPLGLAPKLHLEPWIMDFLSEGPEQLAKLDFPSPLNPYSKPLL